VPGLAGSGWGSKKQRFLFKILLKNIDFECQGSPGAGGDQKSNDFLLKSFSKITILSARAGRERAGVKQATMFN